jgi:nifR3 family TIM-barrel protein
MESADFRAKLILAPLAGITDSVFRLLCRENGADIVVTEMASARGLLLQPARTGRYLAFREEERPVGAQIYGSIPGEIAEAAEEVRRMGFDFLDINMGCPVRKVTAGGSGAALLADPLKAGRLVAAAVDRAGIPVTVKIRSGFGADPEAYLAVAGEAFAAGAAAVILHPRTRGQMFGGTADWEQIARLKREFPERIVIGNGDVRTPEDARRMRAQTGCDAVMVGRASLGNPWIFREIQEALRSEGDAAGSRIAGGYGGQALSNADRNGPASNPGRSWRASEPGRSCQPSSVPPPSVVGHGPCGVLPGHTAGPSLSAAERKALILRHGEEMHRLDGASGIVAMRKHLAWYSRGIPGASSFRGALVRVDTLESFRAVVERFF